MPSDGKILWLFFAALFLFTSLVLVYFPFMFYLKRDLFGSDCIQREFNFNLFLSSRSVSHAPDFAQIQSISICSISFSCWLKKVEKPAEKTLFEEDKKD